MSTRFYLHGDEHEPGSWYCASCDLCANALHFDDPAHQRNAERKFRSTEKTLIVYQCQKNGQYFRPNNAKNLFGFNVKMKTEGAGRFLKWLKRQSERDDPVGDLAKDALNDATFPRNTQSRDILRRHLQLRHACLEAFVALDEALFEFRTSLPRRESLSPKLRFDVFKRDGYRCRLCGTSAVDGTQLEIDHIHPVAKGGGSDCIENLQTLCKPCNRGKGVSEL
jgi:uncharacterized protein YozE (UPF0346 family)